MSLNDALSVCGTNRQRLRRWHLSVRPFPFSITSSYHLLRKAWHSKCNQVACMKTCAGGRGRCPCALAPFCQVPCHATEASERWHECHETLHAAVSAAAFKLHRSPWSIEYDPLSEDGLMPPSNSRSQRGTHSICIRTHQSRFPSSRSYEYTLLSIPYSDYQLGFVWCNKFVSAMQYQRTLKVVYRLFSDGTSNT